VRIFLGVDGGGTKTQFMLIDESGQVLATRREGSAYFPQTGVDALQTMLVAGIHETLARASVMPAEVDFAFIGLPAYGEDSRLLPRLDRIASPALPAQRYSCANDMVCGWAGALAGRDGINIVAGTGSIGYGEFEGRSARAGGWGELFSDEGSAYWIARESLNLFSRMSDGRARRTPLYALLRDHFGLSTDLDLCAAAYGPPPLSRSDIAALAPLVAQAARAGDAEAHRLFRTAADELAAIVHAVREHLAVPTTRPLPVSYSGGVFQLDNVLAPLLQAALNDSGRPYEFAPPRLPPDIGAALHAARLAGAPLSAEAVERLERSHGAPPR
jgi:N-acetylglucosamine kinase-like BadF-type ATPase